MARISKDDWAILSPLLDQALNLPPGERIAWLAQQRLSHPTRAAEVEALLNREVALEQEGFLGPGQAPELPVGSTLVGQRFGPWTIERELGRGGMGSVWLARRNDGRFEGLAAIKFLSLAVAGPTGEARFRQEGSLLARLTHPNIARLLDAGVSPMGQPYLVLEYIDGRQLDAWCDEHRLDVEGRLRLFLQVLAAVGHAHANLIVHRDLKPSNILVTGDGSVKLLDFGIARMLETGGVPATPLTGTREAVFTYQYAAPEQITGDPISTATDVYSLGVLLYELLAGQHPTGADAESPADHLRATLDTDPSPLSRMVTPRATLSGEESRRLAETRDTSPEKLSRVFAGDLDNILAKALRKEPAHRYATVTAFGDDLQRYLDHQPVLARADTWGYRAGKFVRRHRGSVSSAVLVAIVLVGAAVMTTLQAREARLQRDMARTQVRRMLATSTVQSSMVSNARGPEGRQLTFEEKVGRAIRLLQADFKDRPWLVAEVMTDLAARFGPDEFDQHQSILGEAQAIARTADARQQLANASCQRAFAWLYLPAPESARADLNEGLAALATQRGPIDIENRLACLMAEAEVLSAEGQRDSSVRLSALGVKLSEPSSDGEEVSTKGNRYTLMGSYARILRAAGRLRQAINVQRQLLVEMDSAGYATDGEMDIALSNLALSLHQVGEYALTDSLVAAVIAHQEAENGREGMTNIARFIQGTVKLRLGLPDSADRFLSKALQDTTAGQGGISYWVAPIVGQLRLEQHRLPEAAKLIGEVQLVSKSAAVVRSTLDARLRYEQGDRAGAATALERNLKEWSADSALRMAAALPFVIAGEWRLAAGDNRGADSLARAAIASAAIDSIVRTHSATVGRAELLSARALAAQQRQPDARAAAERAVVALRNGAGPTRPLTRQARALVDSLPR